MSGAFAAASPFQGVPNIAALLAGFGGRLPTLTDRQYEANNAVFNVKDFGATGDGVTDDSSAINRAATAALGTFGVSGTLRLPQGKYLTSSGVSIPAGVILDLTEALVIANASWSLGQGVSVRGGMVTWTVTTAIDAMVPIGDACTFDGVTFVGNGTIGNAGAPLYQRGINGTKYNRIVVVNCAFSNMTVGVWAGGGSLDPTPVGWRVLASTFTNIVGFRGQSEGYGVLLTPCSNSYVAGNVFSTIARHAIYLAGGACKNVVAGNNIDTCDNVGIQVNTFASQPASDGNLIALNVINKITKSIAYGYLSAVGIGVYGNNTNTMIVANRISRFVDQGIVWSSSSTDMPTVCVGFGAAIADNWIDGNTDVAASDSCLRVDNPDNASVTGNRLQVAQNQYGLVVTSNFAPNVNGSRFADNSAQGYGAECLGYRVAGAAAPNVFERNSFAGLGTKYSVDANIGAATIDTQIGFVGIGDNDFTYQQGVNPALLVQSTGLTANRIVTLSVMGVVVGSIVRVSRSSSGASSLSVKDGGGAVLKNLATNQWADFGFNGAAWTEIAFGAY